MPNPCITSGACIFPDTIIKLQSSISPCMNHALTGSLTSARLLPVSLASLKCYSPPTVKSQHTLWQRHPVCLPHTCSEFEMSSQTHSPAKTATPPGTWSNTENSSGKTSLSWSKVGDEMTTLGFQHLIPCTSSCKHLWRCLSFSLSTVSSDTRHVPCPGASQHASSWHKLRLKRQLQPRGKRASAKTFSASALRQGRATLCLLVVLPRSANPRHSTVQPSDLATSIWSHVPHLFLGPDPSQVGRGLPNRQWGLPAWQCKHRPAASPNLEQHVISSLLASLYHKALTFLLKRRAVSDGQDHSLSVISVGERAAHSTFSPLTWYK